MAAISMTIENDQGQLKVWIYPLSEHVEDYTEFWFEIEHPSLQLITLTTSPGILMYISMNINKLCVSIPEYLNVTW